MAGGIASQVLFSQTLQSKQARLIFQLFRHLTFLQVGLYYEFLPGCWVSYNTQTLTEWHAWCVWPMRIK